MNSAVPRIAAAFAVVLAVGLSAACGSSDQREATPATDQTSLEANHNAADVAFARTMVQHHEQSVEMAQMAPTHTRNRAVVDLANQIATTQVPEIKAFQAKLMQWHSARVGDAAGHDGQPMAGVVDEATMGKLATLTGPEFDRLWLTLMIDHHRGAIAMAKGEVASGKNPDVIYLAESIISRQQAEIDQMKEMLGG